METFTLILMLYSGWDENALAITTVDNFKTEQSCKIAGNKFKSEKVGTAYRQEFVCVKVN